MSEITNENRTKPRRSSLYAVMVEIGDRSIAGRIRDHSDTGCRLSLDQPLRVDDVAVAVVRGEHRMTGEIAWKEGRSVGIRFPSSPPDGMFSPSLKTATSERRQVSVGRRFRRPGLGSEALTPVEAEHGRLWVSGALESRS